MTWLPVDRRAVGERDAVLALQPEAGRRWMSMLERSWAIADPELLGLCSLRIAQLLECDAVLESEGGRLPAEVAMWRSSGSFAPIERAALAYAEQFVVDQNGVAGELEDGLREHLTRRELCNLVQALNAHDGYMRAMSLLDVEPAGQLSGVPRPDPVERSEASIGADEPADGKDLDLFAALTDPEFFARRSAFGATTALLTGVDPVTTEICRLRNANHQACAF